MRRPAPIRGPSGTDAAAVVTTVGQLFARGGRGWQLPSVGGGEAKVMYLVALLVVVLVAALCWKAFGPVRASSRSRGGRIIGPDDDPEFLWSISQHQHPGGDSGDS